MTNALRFRFVIRPHKKFRSLSRVALTLGAVAVAATVGFVGSPRADRTVEAVGGALGSGGEFQEIAPTRIFDSRDPDLDVQPLGRKPLRTFEAGTAIDIPVVGEGGLPEPLDDDNDGQDDNVLAVVANITVIQPTHIGFLRAFGKGAPEGETSVVNFFPGTILPNTAILRPGEDGMISLRFVSPTTSGSVDVAVDITGWFSTTTYGERGDRVIPIDPVRVYDSELSQFGGTTLVGRSQIEVPIRGAAGVIPDNDNVVGAVVNVTGVNVFGGSAPTFIAALPEPAVGSPSTSTVNLVAGQVRANMAILPVGPDGSIHLFNLQGEVRMVLDVVAYLSRNQSVDTRAGRVVPLVAPFRAFDTREPAFGDQPLGPAQAEDFSFESFVNDVTIDGVSVGAQSALIGNLTATDLQRQYSWAEAATFMTAFPSPGSGTAVPEVSNINIGENDTVPNLALLPYGDSTQGPNSIRFYNRAGYIDYLLDVYAVVLDD